MALGWVGCRVVVVLLDFVGGHASGEVVVAVVVVMNSPRRRISGKRRLRCRSQGREGGRDSVVWCPVLPVSVADDRG